MKVGVKIGPALDASVAPAAQEAERAGFDSVWLSERVVIPLDKPHAYEPTIDPWIGLAFVAAATERVRIGTSVSQIALRPPVLMARELATLDRLSGGRLIVGAGAGWVVEEFLATGIGFDDRGGRLSEHIQVMRHLWTTPEAPWRGKFYDLPAVGIVSPLTAGGPPIFVGALNDAGMRRAARYADGFISVGQPLEVITNMRDTIASLRSKYNRTSPFEVWTQAPPPDDIAAAKQMAHDYNAARIDGVILTYASGVPDAFTTQRRDVAQAFIESAAAA